MTNLPSREDLDSALSELLRAYKDYAFAMDLHNKSDHAVFEASKTKFNKLVDNLYSAALEPLTLEKAKCISSLVDIGAIVTLNDVRTKILGWPPLPPDDHRGNSLLRRDP